MPTRQFKNREKAKAQIKRIEKLFKPLFNKAYKAGDTERMEQLKGRFKKAYIKFSLHETPDQRKHSRFNPVRDAEYATDHLVEKSKTLSNG